MRPKSLDDVVGQEHLVGPGKLLRRLVDEKKLPSLILFGPPGTGKTTLARILARSADADFEQLSAVSAGVADLRRVVAGAEKRWAQEDRATVLFLDEIHRFNKSQQDSVLGAVEDGTITMMGATTENPSFEVNAALLSRCRVFPLQPLGPDTLVALFRRVLEDRERGLGSEEAVAEGRALEALAEAAGGDARRALTALEMAVAAAPRDAQGRRVLTEEHVLEVVQHRTFLHDKSGDAHFDTISAFIKSVRGSDVDAALYWLARLLEAGEDPLFVVRRLVILAAEDIGMADPRGIMVATACQQAVHFLGLPEGYLPMAQCTIYLATAPKSNSALTSYQAAAEDARRTGSEPVPLHLRNAVTGLGRSLGHGAGYQYAHDRPGEFPDHAHLPASLAGRDYYLPSDQGYEQKLRAWVEERRRRMRRS